MKLTYNEGIRVGVTTGVLAGIDAAMEVLWPMLRTSCNECICKDECRIMATHINCEAMITAHIKKEALEE